MSEKLDFLNSVVEMRKNGYKEVSIAHALGLKMDEYRKALAEAGILERSDDAPVEKIDATEEKKTKKKEWLSYAEPPTTPKIKVYVSLPMEAIPRFAPEGICNSRRENICIIVKRMTEEKIASVLGYSKDELDIVVIDNVDDPNVDDYTKLSVAMLALKDVSIFVQIDNDIYNNLDIRTRRTAIECAMWNVYGSENRIVRISLEQLLKRAHYYESED